MLSVASRLRRARREASEMRRAFGNSRHVSARDSHDRPRSRGGFSAAIRLNRSCVHQIRSWESPPFVRGAIRDKDRQSDFFGLLALFAGRADARRAAARSHGHAEINSRVRWSRRS